MKLSTVTGPAVEPVTLDELKDHMRIIGPDDDALVSLYRLAARQHAEGLLGRALITQTLEYALDFFPPVIRLPRPPLQSITSVTYTDTDGGAQVLSSSLYTVDTRATPGTVRPAYDATWPSTRAVPNAVVVRYVAGYGTAPGDVPEMVRNWIMVTAATMYEFREDAVTGTIPAKTDYVKRAALGGYRVHWPG